MRLSCIRRRVEIFVLPLNDNLANPENGVLSLLVLFINCNAAVKRSLRSCERRGSARHAPSTGGIREKAGVAARHRRS